MTIIQQIREKMTIKSIFNLMAMLNAEPKIINDNMIEGITVCHHGSKRKLYYYQDSKMFFCYTNCGSMNIITLFEKHFNCNYSQAINALKKFFKISNFDIGNFVSTDYQNEKIDIPSDDVKKELSKNKNISEDKIPTIDNNIINSYYKSYPVSWLKEGITKQTMDKYHIRFDILNHRIIIPAYRSDGKLIGIRCRELDALRLNMGHSKYYPIVFKGQVLRWPTGCTLYALYHNSRAIRHYKKAILFEGEKSVLKLDRYLGDNNISLALYGSNFTKIQKEALLKLGVEEIVIALDKEFHKDFDDESKLYAKKIGSMARDIRMKCKVSVIWDKTGLLKYKDSPIDEGFDTFLKLFQNRITL